LRDKLKRRQVREKTKGGGNRTDRRRARELCRESSQNASTKSEK